MAFACGLLAGAVEYDGTTSIKTKTTGMPSGGHREMTTEAVALHPYDM